MGHIAWLSVIFSFIYLYFAIKNQSICFLFAIVSSSLWAVESYFKYHLKFDAALQVFYVVMAVVGLYRWKYGGKKQEQKPIMDWSLSRHNLIILGGILLTALMIYGSQFIAEIARPKLDAFTTVFFVIGTLLLVEREIYSWLYLVVCNVVMVYVYLSTEAWLFAAMMLVYAVFGVVGYMNWKRLNAESLVQEKNIF